MFGTADDHFDFVMIGPDAGPVASIQGPRAYADVSYADAPGCEITLVPGGRGNRTLVTDSGFLGWLALWASNAQYVTSVCTGSGLLAASGLLDGYRATSNKRSFAWASAQSSKVEWVAEARWVRDRNRWTSSGVAAGMDMALALVGQLCGDQLAEDGADRVEYERHRDSTWDPFAKKAGLT